jgi:hypothetical protein
MEHVGRQPVGLAELLVWLIMRKSKREMTLTPWRT